MARPVAGFFSLLVLGAGICAGQTIRPAHYIEISLPGGVSSESVFIRYALGGDTLGGWVQQRSGVPSYVIDTTRAGHSAAGIKALMYAPGCGIQTLDVSLSDSRNEQRSFICRPLRSVSIDGRLIRTDRLYGREVKLQARYIARWAQPFLGLSADVVPFIPVGDGASLGGDDRFRISVPDLSRDPLAGAPDHPGELQIWAEDKVGGSMVAQLVPVGSQIIKTRMGGLKIQRAYPVETVFAPCAVNASQRHDSEGFALRPDSSDACDR